MLCAAYAIARQQRLRYTEREIPKAMEFAITAKSHLPSDRNWLMTPGAARRQEFFVFTAPRITCAAGREVNE